MTEIDQSSLSTNTIEHGMTYQSYAKDAVPRARKFFDKKFGLEAHYLNGTLMYENKIITTDDGVYNILYLPYDETRTDKQEQIKISNDKEKITVIVKNDGDDSEVTLETFEILDGQTEKKISTETNTPEVIYHSERMLGRLSRLKVFDAVYSPQKNPNIHE